MDMADAKPVSVGKLSIAASPSYRNNAKEWTGAQSILRAFTRSDFPEDPDRIFLTSWGEWWEKSVIEKSLDKKLQDKWSPSKEEIEKEENLSA